MFQWWVDGHVDLVIVFQKCPGLTTIHPQVITLNDDDISHVDWLKHVRWYNLRMLLARQPTASVMSQDASHGWLDGVVATQVWNRGQHLPVYDQLVCFQNDLLSTLIFVRL